MPALVLRYVDKRNFIETKNSGTHNRFLVIRPC